MNKRYGIKAFPSVIYFLYNRESVDKRKGIKTNVEGIKNEMKTN